MGRRGRRELPDPRTQSRARAARPLSTPAAAHLVAPARQLGARVIWRSGARAWSTRDECDTVLPNATVKLSSAAVGALFASVGWYLALIAHVRFQVGVARFNARYSGSAAFPIFLAWLHLSSISA